MSTIAWQRNLTFLHGPQSPRGHTISQAESTRWLGINASERKLEREMQGSIIASSRSPTHGSPPASPLFQRSPPSSPLFQRHRSKPSSPALEGVAPIESKLAHSLGWVSSSKHAVWLSRHHRRHFHLHGSTRRMRVVHYCANAHADGTCARSHQTAPQDRRNAHPCRDDGRADPGPQRLEGQYPDRQLAPWPPTQDAERGVLTRTSGHQTALACKIAATLTDRTVGSRTTQRKVRYCRMCVCVCVCFVFCVLCVKCCVVCCVLRIVCSVLRVVSYVLCVAVCALCVACSVLCVLCCVAEFVIYSFSTRNH